MKFTFFIVLLILIINSCTQIEKPKEIILSDIEKRFKQAALKLKNDNEKIVLLSKIKNISYDTLYGILLDYTAQTNKYLKKDSSKFYCNIALTTVSNKYGISKKILSKLIFNFKYELLSQEEIGETAIEKYLDEKFEEEDQ